MRKIKSLIAILIVAMCCTKLFAVDAVGLTDKDVKNCAKNWPQIEKAIDKLDESESMESLNKLAAGFGMSGPNEFAKLLALVQCLNVAVVENAISDPSVAQMYQMMGIDPLAAYADLINPEDYKVVKANFSLYEKYFK